MDSLSMVEWSALFNCLRMRFVKIGTDNEMPGRIKLSQPGRDNLPFRAGICGDRGKYVVAISGPREPRRRGPPWAKVCCREALPTTMERARRTMRKTAVRLIGEPFYGFRKDPGRRPSSPARSSCAAPRVRAHREVLFSLVSSSPGGRRMGSTSSGTPAQGRWRYVLPGPA